MNNVGDSVAEDDKGTEKEVLVTDKEWMGREEIVGNCFTCPSCGDDYLMRSHKYCSACGVKINFKLEME